jgi:hypothetical protein
MQNSSDGDVAMFSLAQYFQRNMIACGQVVEDLCIGHWKSLAVTLIYR